MTNSDKVRLILHLSKDIKLFLGDKVKTLGMAEGTDLEVLMYSMFSILNDKLKADIFPKDKLEQQLLISLNQYITNSNLDLYVQKLEYPSRFDPN